MAVSKLWPVTVRLATVLDYASNPEKTTKSKSKYSNADYQALRDVVAYAKDGEKTERELFCEGIHCNPQTAREQFITVKEQFDKPDGIQAYHGYLSFEETDITPELAQQVGMAFAERMWGDRFQVLVTTHLNTEHLHCHFVVNSVSFRDGKRLQNKEKAWWYNPFVYLHSDNDVQRLVTNLFKSTTPKGSQSNDPFWDTSASMLLSALVYYLHYEAPEDEQNFAMVMEMLQAAAIDNEEDPRPSPLDCLFADLELDRPDHIALKYYRSYHTGSAKTLKSIQITLAARLEKFNLESLAALTCTDELDLASMGEKKVALFAIIPDNDSSFNFLVSILYTQLFQQLFFSADHIHGGALPIPVHFLMDEFANVSLPDDFDKILSVMRSRGVFVSIILQNLAQLKALFEKQWESIVGNCDEFLYLGGNEQSTHKYVSELLGKETIDTNTYCAVCLEGAVIVLSCIIFSLFASSPPVVNPDAAAVTQVWSYIGELLFNMLVLVGSVKMSDRIIREMMGM